MVYRSAVFASSLLSLISPWGGSPVARAAPPPPRPPPPPRRHSHPRTHAHAPHTHRRLSHAHPDTLRQELLRLDLDNRELDTWLGAKFEDRDVETDFRFDHDIPLQRTISLDRGIDIFNYLQTLSDWESDVSESLSSLESEVAGSSLRFEQYRSFEDIPASPVRVRSRHISLDVTNSVYGNNLTPLVLKDTYKGIEEESGILTPQIRKLQKTYSFKNFDEYKDSTESLDKVEKRPRSGIEFRVPVYRSIDLEAKDNKYEYGSGNKNSRQRRVGVTHNPLQNNPIQNLRKEVLKHNLAQFRSYDNIFTNPGRISPISAEAIETKPFASLNDSYKVKYNSGDSLSNIRKLKRNVSFRDDLNEEFSFPKVIITTDSYDSVASVENVKETSDLVDGRTCVCSICSEDEVNKKSFLSRNLHKIFIKLISIRNYGKRLTCWDDNNENEMYSCILHILKFLLGIWLRHLDHKQHNLCG